MFSKKIKLNDNLQEIHISLNFEDELSCCKEFEKAKNLINQLNANIVSLEIFAHTWAKNAIEFFKKSFPRFSINWIYPLSEEDCPILASAHIIALEGNSQLKFVESSNNGLACLFSDSFINYCKTNSLVVDDKNLNNYDETYSNLIKIESILKNVDYSFNDITRTWFYNEDILSWYDDFNKARTKFFNEKEIFKGLLPASTGIGAPNPHNSKITSSALALKILDKSSSSVKEVQSPLQCGAPDYGSSFSRAIKIETPFCKKIMISGTASIEPNGKTAYIDDIEKQIELTMQVIEAILKDNNMTLKDTFRSIIYCLKPSYYEYFLKWCKNRNLEIPHCPSYSIVCRDDLLFEVELDAFIAK